MGLSDMDITLERILTLIPKKPDGKFVHGAKKEFADSLSLPHNIIAEWVRGKNKGYHSYLYEIAAKYNVSVEWLKGETDEKRPIPKGNEPNKEALLAAVDSMSRYELIEFMAMVAIKIKEK